MDKKTGGPAFPTPELDGMTLRDAFAIGSLVGLVSKYNIVKPGDQDTIAEMAYSLADAMLAERDK